MKTQKNKRAEQSPREIQKNQFKELTTRTSLGQPELALLQGGESSTKTAEKYLHALSTSNGIT